MSCMWWSVKQWLRGNIHVLHVGYFYLHLLIFAREAISSTLSGWGGYVWDPQLGCPREMKHFLQGCGNLFSCWKAQPRKGKPKETRKGKPNETISYSGRLELLHQKTISIAVGLNCYTRGQYLIAVGLSSYTRRQYLIAVGLSCYTRGQYRITIGLSC